MAEELSTEETAYMDSHGETELPAAEETETVEEEVQDSGGGEENVEKPEETTTEGGEEGQDGAKEVEEPAQEKEKSKWVPMARFEEKNRQIDGLGAKLQAESEARAKMEGRLEILLKQGEAPPPDPDEDPEAFHEHQIAERDTKIAKLTEKTAHSDQLADEQAEVQKVHNVWTAQVAEASDPAQTEKFVPHYQEAQEFMLNSRRQELRALGMTDPEKLEQHLGVEVWGAVNGCHKAGFNIPKYVEKMAKDRGWVPPNGVDKATEKTPEGEKLETLEKAQEAQSPLKDGGKTSSTALTLKAIAAMSDEDFDKMASDPDYMKQIKRLSGG